MLPPALINLQDARLAVLTRYKTYHYGSNHIILWKPEQEWKKCSCDNDGQNDRCIHSIYF